MGRYRQERVITYLTHLNTSLSVAYGRVKTAMYGQERLLIAPVTSKVEMQVEMGRYG